jgi:hypothetical protein
MDLKIAIIQRLDEARYNLETVVSHVDISKEIYPDWTMKQMLDHIAGWDDAVIASLRSHLDGETPGTPAERGVDYYNAQTVETRESLDYDHTFREWQASRLLLKQLIRTTPDEKLAEPLIAPWGEKGTISQIVEIFANHEEEHTADILRWLRDPNQPITDSKA